MQLTLWVNKLLLNLINKFLNFFAIIIIKMYQYLVSPFIRSNCRFQPTCSAYALASFRKYNFFVACKLTMIRLLKCHPFGSAGYDPLPK
ncbi:Putative membrane protein insertion efficiency factor [Candidatus Hepatincola sp. Av]